MRGTNINKSGKTEKNTKVKEGDCIFPFKYQWKENNECTETERGKICATSTSERGTLKTYGYCSSGESKSKSNESLKKGTKKKALTKTLKKRKSNLKKQLILIKNIHRLFII